MYLNTHSFFSLNYGVMPVAELLQQAKDHGITHLALTDINNTSGCIDFMRHAPKYGIHAAVGVDFRIRTAQQYVAIARNEEGFRQINEFLSQYKVHHRDIPPEPPVLPDCRVIVPWRKDMILPPENVFIGLSPRDVAAFRIYGKDIPIRRLVAMPTASFRHKRDFNTHRLLRAVYHNTLLSKLPVTEQGRPDDVFLPPAGWKKIYEGFEEAVDRSLDLLQDTRMDFHFGVPKNKVRFTESDAADVALLEKLAYEGLQYRYSAPGQHVADRLRMELDTIVRLGFTAYFLINWDIVHFASSRGFFHIGRGSGANSLVAYCLRITDVDPIELDLYFERFINPSRKSPPDFDIDFSHTDRDTVRQYIFDKYRGHVALVGSYTTFERKSCIREIGKVFGLPDVDIDALQADRKPGDQYGQLVLQYAACIHGLPHQLSVHSCGIIISEKPITCYSALELFPVGFPSVQFSMLEAEDVGLNKYDILSQRGLGHIKDAVTLVKQNQGIDIDIHRIQDFKKDERIRQMLRTGNTVGCFYVESPAMRQLLRKLQVQDYLGLVAASSVIRPGVSSSGMMREYILRYRDPERRKLAHPKLLEIMPETYGVMVYQEDVIKVAHYYAGLTLEEADVMRRGMSGKFRSRSEFQRVRDAFFANCKARAYPDEEAAEIWRQMESFAGYSFAKGHSASYAVESYQSLFLRAYYPMEFMTAVLNNFGGYYTTEFYLHEARMAGADVQLPCINRSENLAALYGNTLYMGFCLIKDLEQKTVLQILSARAAEGDFRSLEDFVRRVRIALEQLRILIRISAFRFTGKTAKELLWDAHMMLGKERKTDPHKALFETPPPDNRLPELEYDPHETALDEMKILSFPFTSPFQLLRKQYKGTVFAEELKKHVGNVVYLIGYYVNIRKVTTINGDTMYFGCFIDSKGKLFDTVHFPQCIARYPFSGRGCYLIKGRVIEDFDVPCLEVSHMEKIAWVFG